MKERFIENRMAKKNSNAILSKTFDFDPQEYLDKSLLFDLKRQVRKKFLIQSLKKYWTLTRITLKIEKILMLLE